MYKIFMVLLGLALCVSAMQAQSPPFEDLLQRVEANNKSLLAYRSYMQKESLQYKSENKLPNLQASAYYLPFGAHTTGNYSEFEIAQSLEFPTVYVARSNWINAQEKRLAYQYQELKQDILLSAQKLGLEWIYLQKKRELVDQRIIQAQKVYTQIELLFDRGQRGILDLNKAKIDWLNQQFALEDLDTRKAAVIQKLQSLNGGNTLSLELNTYPNTIEIPSLDSLWEERSQQDVQLALLEQEKQVAEQGLEVERKQLLPDITLGYNYQGVVGSNYSGFYGGISIPLWTGRSKVKMAEAQITYYEQQQSGLLTSLKSEYISQVQRYKLLISKFREYQQAIQGLNSEVLLEKSYELGEISFLDYYREVSFYREAENRMLEIEKELQQLKLELFKHQL